MLVSCDECQHKPTCDEGVVLPTMCHRYVNEAVVAYLFDLADHLDDRHPGYEDRNRFLRGKAEGLRVAAGLLMERDI